MPKCKGRCSKQEVQFRIKPGDIPAIISTEPLDCPQATAAQMLAWGNTAAARQNYEEVLEPACAENCRCHYDNIGAGAGWNDWEDLEQNTTITHVENQPDGTKCTHKWSVRLQSRSREVPGRCEPRVVREISTAFLLGNEVLICTTGHELSLEKLVKIEGMLKA